MNIQEYIDSGIVQSYVLGFATRAEEKEFEDMCAQYPEVLAARTQFEIELQNELMQGSVKPPDNLKAKILAALNQGLEHETPTEQKTTLPGRSPVNWWKWVAAASIIALMLALVFAISTMSRYKKMENENASIRKQINGLPLADPILAIKPLVEKPSVRWTALLDKSNPAHCMAHLYWDSTTKETFLLVGNISNAQRDAEFHLVAVNESKLNDLGQFGFRNEGAIVKMKKISNPKSFIITVQYKTSFKNPSKEMAVAEGNL